MVMVRRNILHITWKYFAWNLLFVETMTGKWKWYLYFQHTEKTANWIFWEHLSNSAKDFDWNQRLWIFIKSFWGTEKELKRAVQLCSCKPSLFFCFSLLKSAKVVNTHQKDFEGFLTEKLCAILFLQIPTSFFLLWRFLSFKVSKSCVFLSLWFVSFKVSQSCDYSSNGFWRFLTEKLCAALFLQIPSSLPTRKSATKLVPTTSQTNWQKCF